ncbi:MAG TPA: class I adenylate-forming enzyme family protein [Acidimicrobiales bacterium]
MTIVEAQPPRTPKTELHPTLPVVLRAAAERFGDRQLLVLPDHRLTFADAEARSRLLARRLLAAGVGKGTRVAMHFPYSGDFLVAWLAVGRIGALVAPLSTAYTPHEVASALRRSDADVLLVPSRMMGRDELAFLREAVPALPADDTDLGGPLFLDELPYLRRIWVLDDDALAGPAEVVDEWLLEAVEAEVMPADWIVLIQTSGSTAEPKGVLHTHGAFLRRTLPAAAPPGPGTRVFLGMPFFWVGGVMALGMALGAGTTLVCQERFEAGAALDLIEQEGVVAIAGWLTLADRLRRHPSFPGRRLPPIVGLSTPAAGPPPAFVTPLGMTESMGPHLAPTHPRYGTDVPDDLRGSLGSSGPFYEHLLVDAETGAPIEGDGEGELCIRGYAVTVGMYKREREDVFDPDGWYRTGDRVTRRDGLYFFTGRTTEMIKTHGANVAPPEVEAALETLAGVKHAFVLGIPHPDLEEQVAAVVVPREGAELSVDELRSGAAGLLSSYKVPRVVLLMGEDEVPWLGTGKPDKRAMRPLLEALAARA